MRPLLRLVRGEAREGASPSPSSSSESTPEDRALALRTAAGDAQAPAEVWDRYAGLVRGLVCRIGGPTCETDDLVQEVFLRFFRQVHTLRDPNALRSFLIGITLRVSASDLRSRRVRRWLRLTQAGALPEIEDGTATPPEVREAVARLYGILDDLSARERIAFVLRHVEGHELVEVASQMECSLATVKRVLARAQAHVQARVSRDPVLAPYAEPGGVMGITPHGVRTATPGGASHE
jgi:RNA polymerase sigma-70 factor (ECF subfamily)